MDGPSTIHIYHHVLFWEEEYSFIDNRCLCFCWI